VGNVKLVEVYFIHSFFFSQAVSEFKENPDVTVMLISLKAGGVALNLTVANYIFLMGK
jgi:SNF2 family DNA or RNA helicase